MDQKTFQEEYIEQMVSFLELAEKMGNIKRICKVIGMPRSTYYRLRKIYRQFGPAGFLPKPHGPKNMPNRATKEIEQAVLSVTEKNPRLSYLRISNLLSVSGPQISGSGVRKIWLRHGLTDRESRETWARQQNHEGG